ncbi:flagellar assembly factor FliW [Caloramator quimbayensis]|uniref:Flagellar assembly factor FliW n=1 Tax=Caloramator quimbayensis TaxID=1147123 RepID=A0A1T4X9C3_9CLOT|nr:flagellar assembly protein FliW [Caloramator quimbayensis]SKA86163.1 flagellar assembly factor FliW [Caloramator quimbayensis]
MIVNTKFFDDIEIDEKEIIYFKDGIPGFEEYKRYVILNIDDKCNLKCLQSVDERDVCLIVINPFEYFLDFEIELSDEEILNLEIENESDVIVYSVLTIRDDKITANLLAPIIINVLKMKGKQIILTNRNYSIRQEIKCL